MVLSAVCALALSVSGAFAASSTSSDHLKHNGDIERAVRARLAQTQGYTGEVAAQNAYAWQLASTIASLQQQGKNVVDLQNGLTRFRGQIATNQTALQDLNTMIANHVGFDAQGNVLDQGQARWTVGSMHTSLLLIKQTTSNAKKDLNNLLHRWGKTYGVFGSNAVGNAF
jgi:hypothetical protein